MKRFWECLLLGFASIGRGFESIARGLTFEPHHRLRDFKLRDPEDDYKKLEEDWNQVWKDWNEAWTKTIAEHEDDEDS